MRLLYYFLLYFLFFTWPTAVFREQRRRTLLGAFSGIWRRQLDAVCVLLTAMLVVPSTRRSTLGDRAFPLSSARVWNSLPSSVMNASSLTTFRRELMTTFSVVVWQWLGDRDCTAQYNCCLRATTDCRRFCSFCFFVLFNFVQCPCNVLDNFYRRCSALVGSVVQWKKVGVWPANFPSPALDLQLLADHLCG